MNRLIRSNNKYKHVQRGAVGKILQPVVHRIIGNGPRYNVCYYHPFGKLSYEQLRDSRHRCTDVKDARPNKPRLAMKITSTENTDNNFPVLWSVL